MLDTSLWANDLFEEQLEIGHGRWQHGQWVGSGHFRTVSYIEFEDDDELGSVGMYTGPKFHDLLTVSKMVYSY
jgi:hypothetical protein